MGFAEKGISRSENHTKDGKKFFDCRKVSITDIINVKMSVIDFEENIMTPDMNNRSIKNQDRYVVFVQLDSGEKVKFITNSIAIKAILDECRQVEKNGHPVFPVENVTIRRIDIGRGRISYKFEDL